VGEKKVYGGNDLPKSQVLSSEWKTERVREDASGDREDGEEDDDELPCVIGESEGDGNWKLESPSTTVFFYKSILSDFNKITHLFHLANNNAQHDQICPATVYE